MPRCPAHCPPQNNGPLPAAAIIAGAAVIVAAATVIVHLLIILLITLGVVAGLGVTALAAVLVIRARGTACEPRAPGRLQARAGALRASQTADGGQRQITGRRAPAADYRPAHHAGHRPAAAIEQHWHLHLHRASEERLARTIHQAPGRTPTAPM
jgi:hypothetical protein